MEPEFDRSQESATILESTLKKPVAINPYSILIAILLLVVVFTRFYNLESRVMSHDESLHTQFSWYLSEGRGFSHDPLMHGPLQFHLIAFSYFLFGDSDASARIPAAAAGILSVLLVLLFHRWLGKWGALAAATLMAFSPYMLYYSRYVRNEAIVVPLALLMFYAVFRYFDDREAKWLYLLAGALALNYTAKETAFIYSAQLLIFLAAFFAWRVLRQPWREKRHKYIFSIGLSIAALGTALGIVTFFRERASSADVLGEISPAVESASSMATSGSLFSPLFLLAMLLAVGGLILITVSLIFAFGKRLRTEFPSLDLIIIVWTFTLPQLAALVASVLGWGALEYRAFVLLSRGMGLVFILLVLSAAIGIIWNWKKWLISAGIFFGIFIVFYTTFFTNNNGISSGFIGSLAYWLEQHGVERGSQPWFYYIFLQIPVYEFLLAIGSSIALYFGFKAGWNGEGGDEFDETGARVTFPVIAFLGYWTLTSLAAYTFAGERMPWLTVHIVFPMTLFAGWGIAKYLQTVDWDAVRRKNGWLAVILLIVIIIGAIRMIGMLFGGDSPFQGSELTQLNTTGLFIATLTFVILACFALFKVSKDWKISGVIRLGGAVLLMGLGLLTLRTSIRASFANYDFANEYLVYAHSATGVKTAMQQIEDLSIRTTDGLDIKVAYDDDVSWPLNWYLRNYPNQFFYGGTPTRELLNYPVILVGDNNWQLVEPLLGDRYNSYEYIRMWWPNQDYWNIKPTSIEAERNRLPESETSKYKPLSLGEYISGVWQHIRPFFTDADTRQAVWEIWLNRDFEKYGEIMGKDMGLTAWSPADRMKLFIRKDVAAQVWDYGVSAAALDEPILEDPYEDRMMDLTPDITVGGEGVGLAEFIRPRGIAIAPDGSIYITDTGNHRIQHLDSDGEVISTWGTFGDLLTGDAPGGTFNEPWDIAVAPNGDVLVADTWNHRIQRFTPDGEFIRMFGSEGIGETSDVLWGPRGVAVDQEGRIFVADTGNKWIKVFDEEGEFVTQFGGAGYLPGYLDEPVGVAVNPEGAVYVADTWNQRIQVFMESAPELFDPSIEWNMDAWYGQSLENKPYLSTGPDGTVCATDPESFRVLCFESDGNFIIGWGGLFGDNADQFNLLSGIALGEDGVVWVVDSGNNRIQKFIVDFDAVKTDIQDGVEEDE